MTLFLFSTDLGSPLTIMNQIVFVSLWLCNPALSCIILYVLRTAKQACDYVLKHIAGCSVPKDDDKDQPDLAPEEVERELDLSRFGEADKIEVCQELHGEEPGKWPAENVFQNKLPHTLLDALRLACHTHQVSSVARKRGKSLSFFDGSWRFQNVPRACSCFPQTSHRSKPCLGIAVATGGMPCGACATICGVARRDRTQSGFQTDPRKLEPTTGIRTTFT